MTENLAKQVLEALKTEVQQTLTYVRLVLCAQAGVFPRGAPFPLVVIAPDSIRNTYANLNHTLERDGAVTIYGYTEAYGEERGLLGRSDLKGVVDLGFDLEQLLLDNRLNGLVRSMEVVQATYPIPPQQWCVGLNEVRVQVRWKARQRYA